MIIALACAVTLVSRTERLDPITLSSIVLFLMAFLGAWVCNKLGDAKEKAELRAGYTTAARGNNEVARVHSPTGIVMRRAGQPNLTRAQWEQAMCRVRDYEASHGTN